MRFFISPSLIATVLLLIPCAANAASASRPFIERVKPDDFYAAEKLFGETYSSSNELVILRTTAAKPVSVLAIARVAGADGYTLTYHLASDDAPGGWLKITEELDASLGRQVLRAIELKLHRQVTLSKFKHTVSKTDSDLWLHQRLSDDRVAAAVIATDPTIDNPAATLFVDDFLGSLQQLIGKEGAERDALLQKIDRTATEIVLAETP